MSGYESYEHAGQIPFKEWHEIGIKIPILDKDGTLTSFHSDEFVPEVIEGMIAGGISDFFPRIALVSNSNDVDHINKVADNLSSELGGVEIYSLCRAQVNGRSRKPYRKMGLMVARHFNVETAELGVIGDRRLVDVRFGKRLGAGAIALCDKVGDGDQKGVPLIRLIEKAIVSSETYFGFN